MKDKNKYRSIGPSLLIGGAIVALLFASTHVFDPITADGIWFWVNAHHFFKAFPSDPGSVHYELFHPPTYLFFLIAGAALFGLTPFSFHLVGLSFFLLNLYLIWKVALVVYSEHDERELLAGLACLLYATNPLAIQSGLVVDIDNTILPPFLMLFALFLLRHPEKVWERNRTITLGLLWSLALWAKPTTSLVLPVVTVLWLGGRMGFSKALRVSAALFTLGFLVFVFSYLVFSEFTGRPFIEMVREYVELLSIRIEASFLSNVNIRDFGFLSVLVRRSLRVILWIGPFFSIAFLLGIWTRVCQFLRRRALLPEDFLWGVALVILGGYILFGGISFGYPKYHLPALTFSVIPLGSLFYPSFKKLMGKGTRGKMLLLGGGCLLFQLLFVGDLLYLTDYALKEKLILDPEGLRRFFWSTAFRLCLSFLPLVFLFFFLRIRQHRYRETQFVTALLIAALSQSVALDLHQARAPYQTTFTYGASGTKEMIHFLKSGLPGHGKLLAPPDISMQIDLPRVAYAWSDENPESFKQDILKYLQDPEVTSFGYGLSAVTLRQNRILREKAIQQFLTEEFTRHDIGSYTLWLRKEGEFRRERGRGR